MSFAAATPATILDVFPERVLVGALPRFEPRTPCLLWTGGKNGGGYGFVTYRGERWLAHRLAYFLRHGRINDALNVCHTCDRPPCCNWEHLFEGTDGDNARDRIKWAGTLSDEEIAAIRASSLPETVLARRFKIRPNQVAAIRPRGYKPNGAHASVTR